MFRRILLPGLLAALITLPGCGRKPLSTAPESMVPGSGAEAGSDCVGRSRSALEAFHRPQAWNGNLVLYAHGVVDPGLPVALPTTQDNFETLRDRMLERGYAVAYSSYSENGYAVKDGMEQTRQLLAKFKARHGAPKRVYLVGHSIGALIALSLAERHPHDYAGVLPISGLLGGGLAEIHYMVDARVAFDYFFPGVIPGDAFQVPRNVDFQPGSPQFMAVLNALQSGFVAPGTPTLQFASVARLPGTTAAEIVESALNVLGFSVRYTNDLLAHTQGRIPYDNRRTIYSGSADDAALNAGVDRFTASPSALRYLERYATPSGANRIPTLTAHTTLDPVVPFFHEQLYAERVARNGDPDRLVQWSIERYGHARFSVEETMEMFDALARWVETGIKPAPGGHSVASLGADEPSGSGGP